MFASKSEQGFYDPIIHGDAIPVDAVEISREEWQSLIDGQSKGKQIFWGEGNYPLLIDRPPPSPELLASAERQWRDARLLRTDGVVSRHRDELEGGGVMTLTPKQYSELQQHRQALRHWPAAGEFPLLDYRPPTPDWLADQLP